MTEGTKLAELTLPVLGMSCSACQHHVEETLAKLNGVAEVHVDLMAHRAHLRYDAAATRAEVFVEAIRKAGYDSVLPRENGGAELAPAAKDRTMPRAIFALLAGAVAMLLSMPLMMAPGSSMSAFDLWLMSQLPALYSVAPEDLRFLFFALTLAVIDVAGRGIYLAAWKALRQGTTNMNTLVSLGTATAFLWSAWATIFPAPDRPLYFDSVPMILGFLLLGKALEGRAKLRALSALKALAASQPATARLVTASGDELRPVGEIRVGDRIRILPGERVPVDCILREGRTSVDESLLTGESTPLERIAGSKLLAGSLNYDGAVLCEVLSVGAETMLGQIRRMVEQAQGTRSPMEGLADRVSRVFVPVVLLLALLTFAGWMLATHSVAAAISAAVSVLVVACPCAMGLAIPAALTVAVGRGAQLGILFKGGEALERLSKLDIVVLDKTGTLTEGRPRLLATHPLAELAEDELLAIAAAAELQSSHPLAHALVDAARERNLALPEATAVQAIPGRGLSATAASRSILLGNPALFADYGIAISAELPPVESGVTRLWFAMENRLVGCFDARDSLAEGAVEAVAALEKAGLTPHNLTGDSPEATARIAAELGIAVFHASLDPTGKLNKIREFQKLGKRVAMVGDGINDAAALAQADAGLAMGSGADLAQEAGDVLLLRPRPGAIPAAIELSRATLRVMRQNLWWAAGYNLIGIPLASGLLMPIFHLQLSPWMASAAMALSSVSVLANSLRLRSWQPAHPAR